MKKLCIALLVYVSDKSLANTTFNELLKFIHITSWPVANSVGIYFYLMKLTFKQSGIRFYFLAKATRYMIKMKYFTVNGTNEYYRSRP